MERHFLKKLSKVFSKPIRTILFASLILPFFTGCSITDEVITAIQSNAQRVKTYKSMYNKGNVHRNKKRIRAFINQKLKNFDVATRVPGKPGYVYSPYVNDLKKIVDIRGIKKGNLARCPFTGKVFVIPKKQKTYSSKSYKKKSKKVTTKTNYVSLKNTTKTTKLTKPKKSVIKRKTTNSVKPIVANLIPGYPNTVFSPFTKTSKPVSVEGYPSGAKVRCPYTDKVFIVPQRPSSYSNQKTIDKNTSSLKQENKSVPVDQPANNKDNSNKPSEEKSTPNEADNSAPTNNQHQINNSGTQQKKQDTSNKYYNPWYYKNTFPIYELNKKNSSSKKDIAF